MKRALSTGDIHSETAGVIFRETGCTHTWKKKLCTTCGTELSDSERYTGKRVNHATAYKMKPPRMAQVINKDSDKPPYVTVTISQTRMYSEKWHGYYHIKSWWNGIEEKLNQDRTLITSYGRKRVFYDAWGEELLKKATAFEPQSTVADHADGKLHPLLGIPGGFIEVFRRYAQPGFCRIVNQSHDSIIVEMEKTDAGSMIPEMHRLLQRPLVVNGEEFTIPVDAEWGERWGELEKVKV